MDTLLQDFRFAIRTLMKSGWFTIVAVACLALGIGVNTAIFSVTNSVILRPFPYERSHELLELRGVHTRRGQDRWSLSYADYLDFKAQSRSFADLAAYYQRNVTLTGPDDAERLQAAQVTTNTFGVLGVAPMRGRAFLPEDSAAGAPRVAVIAHDLWRRRFGSDTTIVGRVLTLSGHQHTVVGIMPPGMKFPEMHEIWLPVRADTAVEARSNRYWNVIGRMRPGATEAQAQADVAAIAARLAKEYPETNDVMSARVLTLHRMQLGDNVYLVIYLMQGSVLFVLLIACANVANLLLARASGRERELAVRTALGAGRGRLVRQLLTESVMLALIGGGLGILVAEWTVEGIKRLIPPDDLPFWMQFGVESNALVFTLIASVITGLLFGVIPALQMSRADVHGALKEGGRGSMSGARSHRLRNTLVVVEIALSLVLLAGAGLMIKSFLRMANEESGFDTTNLLTMRVSLPGSEFDSVTSRAHFLSAIVERTSELPGVRVATYTSLLPLTDNDWTGYFAVEGQDFETGTEPTADIRFVHPTYFETLGIPLLAGRGFTRQEALDSVPVTIVSEALANRFWPKGDALGRRIRATPSDSASPWLTVVGIVPDTKLDIENPRVQLAFYVPYRMMQWRAASLIVRTAVPPATLAAAVRREVRALSPSVPTYDIRTLEEARHRDMWPFRLYGAIFGFFSVIALLLAAIGVYAVMAYGVIQRTREIGVRMALGARGGDVLRLVVRQALVLTAIGLTIGLLGALAVTGSMKSLLYGISPSDPVTYLSISLVLAAVAALASYLPARRAVRVDPMVALRHE